MPLIKCTECKKEISSKASSCPNCGCPSSDGVQTIQQTSKKWKALQFFGTLLILASILIMPFVFASDDVANPKASFVIPLVGIVFYTIGRAGGWWHHG